MVGDGWRAERRCHHRSRVWNVNGWVGVGLVRPPQWGCPKQTPSAQPAQAAKLKLLQFDVLLLLEEPAKDDVILAKAMDWHKVMAEECRVHS